MKSLAISCGLIAGIALAIIGMRRVVRGEMPLFTLFNIDAMRAATRIEIDALDKKLAPVALIAFLLSMIFVLQTDWP
jgi:hypothetical protein